jgi:hypothetical protein
MTAKLGMMPAALNQEFLDRINKITGFFLGLWIHFKPRKRRKARKVCLGWVMGPMGLMGLMGPIGLIAKDVLCCSFTIHYSKFTILRLGLPRMCEAAGLTWILEFKT